jgi:hypothetical protein
VTVSELIERLAQFEPTLPVVVTGHLKTDLVAPGVRRAEVIEYDMDGGHVGSYDIVQLAELPPPDHVINKHPVQVAVHLFANPFQRTLGQNWKGAARERYHPPVVMPGNK